MTGAESGRISGRGAQTRRIYEMRRRVYMGTVVLVSLLCFKVVLIHTSGPSTPLWYRIFNYIVGGYALILLAYTSVWAWLSMARSSTPPLENRDPLTGLLDWGGLVDAVQEERSDSPSEQPLRLVYIDMIGLKQVNAVCGQNMGDSVLQQAARILENQTPPKSPVARLKGDEFVVLLSDQTPKDAEKIRQRIVKKMETHNFGTGDASVSCRASVLPRLTGDCRLVELLATVRQGGTCKGSEDENAAIAEYCAIPQVTISACARYRADSLKIPVRNAFYSWRTNRDGEFVERMAREVQQVLSFKADGKTFDFVTAPPGKETHEDNKPAHVLAKAVAEQLNVPYRNVLTAGPVSKAFAWMEPKLATAVREGSHVLLLSDFVDEGSHTRRCVEKLARAGAFVQVVAWAAKV